MLHRPLLGIQRVGVYELRPGDLSVDDRVIKLRELRPRSIFSNGGEFMHKLSSRVL